MQQCWALLIFAFRIVDIDLDVGRAIRTGI
jgi:hypothetical protein